MYPDPHVIRRQQDVEKFIPISKFDAEDRFDACVPTKLDKFPGIAGGIDIGQGNGRNARFDRRFHQFLRGKRAI